MATTVATPPESQPQIGTVGRMIGALINPKPTFADIVKRPSWLAPVIVMSVVWLALNVMLVRRVDWTQASRQQIEKSRLAASQIEKLPPDQQARAYERAAVQAKYTRYVRGVIGWPLLIVVFGSLYFGVFKLFGARVNYATALAIFTYAHIPLTVRELLGIPVILLKDPGAIDPENFLASNVAALLGSSAPAWQLVIGAWFDVFALWCLALVAIGYAQADPKKISTGKSFGIVFGVSIAIILFFTVIAWAFA